MYRLYVTATTAPTLHRKKIVEMKKDSRSTGVIAALTISLYHVDLSSRATVLM